MSAEPTPSRIEYPKVMIPSEGASAATSAPTP